MHTVILSICFTEQANAQTLLKLVIMLLPSSLWAIVITFSSIKEEDREKKIKGDNKVSHFEVY